MKRSENEFFDLIAAVERQGGQLLDRTHDVKIINMPDSRGNPRDQTLTGCGEVALFEIPYVSTRDERPSLVEVCAIDDCVHLWPRFKKERA